MDFKIIDSRAYSNRKYKQRRESFVETVLSCIKSMRSMQIFALVILTNVTGRFEK